MGIVVASRAASILEPVLHRPGRAARFRRRVAIHACHRHMRPGQRESRGIMLRQCESRGPETLHRVTILTAILVWWPRELPFVIVGVAGRAVHIPNCEDSVDSFGDVALCTRHAGVFALERITRLRMLLHAERRTLERFDPVAERAVGAEPALRELSPMGIGQMAIHALLERYGCLEVARLMTAFAGHRLVSAEKWKRCFRMIETLRELHLFP